MSSSHLRRVGTRVAAVALVVVVLAGCSGQQEPSSYTDSVKRDFTSGCWTTLVGDAHPDEVTFVSTDDREAREKKATEAADPGEVEDAQDKCGCAYAKISKDVPFGDFKDINDELREEQGPLPESFQKAYADCKVTKEG